MNIDDTSNEAQEKLTRARQLVALGVRREAAAGIARVEVSKLAEIKEINPLDSSLQSIPPTENDKSEEGLYVTENAGVFNLVTHGGKDVVKYGVQCERGRENGVVVIREATGRSIGFLTPAGDSFSRVHCAHEWLSRERLTEAEDLRNLSPALDFRLPRAASTSPPDRASVYTPGNFPERSWPMATSATSPGLSHADVPMGALGSDGNLESPGLSHADVPMSALGSDGNLESPGLSHADAPMSALGSDGNLESPGLSHADVPMGELEKFSDTNQRADTYFFPGERPSRGRVSERGV
jgi:hypothetical protein